MSLPENRYFQYTIIGVILLNAVILGLLTVDGLNPTTVSLLTTLDEICLGVFCVELGLKLIGQRLRFFRDGWNVFDFVVVAVALAPATGPLSVLRALRVFRLMRLVDSVPSMRRVMNGMFAAIPGTASVAGVLAVMFYVAGIMATNFFGKVDPDNFGHLGVSFFTLFQFLTMEGWPDVARPIIEKMPYAWMFFIPFILVTTLTTLNLLFGIIVDAMENAKEEEAREDLAEQGIEAPEESNELRLAVIEQEVRKIREKIASIAAQVEKA
ncbi:MAG TPA: ion transporter [Rhodocyclaceae bacterium]|nr:ion transporter [Rhodocyclaceae bacterium]